MVIQEGAELRALYSDPTENFMDENVGTLREMKRLFKVLVQLKKTYNKSFAALLTSGLNYTKDEQISVWVHRTEET